MLPVRVNVPLAVFFGMRGSWEVFWCFESLDLNNFRILDLLETLQLLLLPGFGGGEEDVRPCRLLLGDSSRHGIASLIIIDGSIDWDSVSPDLGDVGDHGERSEVEVGWPLPDSRRGGVRYLKSSRIMGSPRCPLKQVNECPLPVDCRLTMSDPRLSG